MALVAVLILAVMAWAILAVGRTDARLSRNATETARLTSVADAAINLTLLRILGGSGGDALRADGSAFTVMFDGQAAQVSIQAEAGKIDLNQASAEMLRAMFAAEGLDAELAHGLADKLLDWREAKAGKRLDGASSEDYRAAGRAYGPRQGPFESVEEARLVLGMASSTFGKVSPLVTVFAQQPSVDMNVASPDVRRALTAVDGLHAADGLDALPDAADAESLREAARLTLDSRNSLGRTMTIAAEAVGPRGVRVKRSATVRLTGFATQPYWVYDWR
jgi:general secretion pathway protein K